MAPTAAVSRKRKLSHGKTESAQRKVVKGVDELKWRKVDASRALDDAYGFYGLEEIDGVDVKVENGVLRFLATEEGEGEKTQESSEKTEKSEKPATESEKPDEQKRKKPVKKAKQAKKTKSATSATLSNAGLPSLPEEATDEDYLAENRTDAETRHQEVLETPESTIRGALSRWNKTGSFSIEILRALYSLGFREPTEIQQKAIPVVLRGSEVIGKASTGSGKTLAYGLPLIEAALARNNGNSATSNSASSDSASSSFPSGPVAIIFTPTRELAHQVVRHLTQLAEFAEQRVGIVSVTGGLSVQKQLRLLRRQPAIIVATPGRFLEIVRSLEPPVIQKRGGGVKAAVAENEAENKAEEAEETEESDEAGEAEEVAESTKTSPTKSSDITFASVLCQTEFVVLDEADRLFLDGHFEELATVIDLLAGARRDLRNSTLPNLPPKWRSLVFSATFDSDLFTKLDGKGGKGKSSSASASTDEGGAVAVLKQKLRIRSDTAFIDASPNNVVASAVSEALVECATLEKDLFLYYFTFMHPGKTLVFVNAVESVKQLRQLLEELGVSSFSLHSGMAQKQRLRALERFQAASDGVLIASDVAARGLDIPDIQHVVHYHLPRTADTYVHRSGRAGRAGREGVSLILCSPKEAAGPLRSLRRAVANRRSGVTEEQPLPLLDVDFDVLKRLKERVALGKRIADGLLAEASGKKDEQWLAQAAEELGVELDGSDTEAAFADPFLRKRKQQTERRGLNRKEVQQLRAQLRGLLAERVVSHRSVAGAGGAGFRFKYPTGGGAEVARQLLAAGSTEFVGTKKSVFESIKRGKGKSGAQMAQQNGKRALQGKEKAKAKAREEKAKRKDERRKLKHKAKEE